MTDRLLLVGLFFLTVAVLGLWVYTRPRVLTTRLRRAGVLNTLSLNGRPTVLAFTSPDCAPCQTAQRPALEEVTARTGARIEIREIDVLSAEEVARAFGIFTVPSTVVVDGSGKVVAFNMGYASAERLLAQLRVQGRETDRGAEVR